MIKPRIMVTGATGKTGTVVVAELLKAGHPVRALVSGDDGPHQPRLQFGSLRSRTATSVPVGAAARARIPGLAERTCA
ncbi:MAG: NmrA family NAD(P)-binding protein [Candidatus Acidiferrum sp.]